MWHGSFEEYCRFYNVASKHLKVQFPHLMIGGYGSCGVMWINAWKVERARHHLDCFHAFLKFVREHDCPLDFFSWHSYSNIEDMMEQAHYIRDALDEAGFTGVPTCLDEWLPAPSHEKLGSAQQAAEVAAALIALQNGPVDSAAIYDARCGVGNYSPLFNPLTYKPHKAYYAFMAFNELRKRGTAVKVGVFSHKEHREHKDFVDFVSSVAENVYAAAAISTSPLREGGGGEAAGGSTPCASLAVMLANIGEEAVPFELEFHGVDNKRTTAIITDETHTWEETELPSALPPHSILLVEWQ